MAINQPIFLFEYFYDCYAIGVKFYFGIFPLIPVPARLGRLHGRPGQHGIFIVYDWFPLNRRGQSSLVPKAGFEPAHPCGR
jgi:hypothetical protein